MHTLGLIFLLMLNSIGFAATPKEIAVKFTYSRLGKSICSSRVILTPNDSYLVCSGQTNGRQTFLKLVAEPMNSKQIKILAIAEEVAPSGKIMEISRPTIIAADNEPSEISQGDSSGNVEMQFQVTASVVK